MEQAIDDKLRTMVDNVSKSLEQTVEDKTNAIANNISGMMQEKWESIENKQDERHDQLLSAVASMDKRIESKQVSLIKYV